MPAPMTEPTLDEQLLLKGATLAADRSFPFFREAAPGVEYEDFTARPDVAGRYDAASRSVRVNRARTTPLNHQQLAGLVSLERVRGFLGSASGAPFLEAFPLSEGQRTWWERFYLSQGVEAPRDPNERAKIIKGTMLSRILVGDTLPPSAPPLTEDQMRIGAQLQQYGRTGR